MPVYTITSHYCCLRCRCKDEISAVAREGDAGFSPVSSKPFVPGWREVAIPTPEGPVMRGDLCPECVSLLAQFVMSPKPA
jgi:hypothetical protein